MPFARSEKLNTSGGYITINVAHPRLKPPVTYISIEHYFLFLYLTLKQEDACNSAIHGGFVAG